MMKNAFAMMPVAGLLYLLSAGPCAAQFLPPVERDGLRPEGLFPQSAQSWSYIPQIASGPAGGTTSWTTSLTIHNPHPSMTVRPRISFYNSDGEHLPLAFNGMPPQSSWGSGQILPPGGSVHLRDTGRSEVLNVGYAVVGSDWGPVQATATYTFRRDGSPVYAVSVPAAVPSTRHVYAASARSGIALVNPHDRQEISVAIIATDTSGAVVGRARVDMPPLSHTAFPLNGPLPRLDADFEGTITLVSRHYRSSTRDLDYGSTHGFVALVLRENGGVLSSLPSGAVERPIDLRRVLSRVETRIRQAVFIFRQDSNQRLRLALQTPSPPFLNLTEDGSFSVYIDDGIDPGDRCGTIQFDTSLGELLASSESELAFAMGRAMGRLIQCRFDQQQPNAHIRYWHQNDDELDADSWGIALSMLAGYDPYAAAGALAKISMVIGAEASNGTHFDRDRIWRRLDRLNGLLRNIHNTVFGGGYEDDYRRYYYPHFPRQQPTTAPEF